MTEEWWIEALLRVAMFAIGCVVAGVLFKIGWNLF
jgi:hypothetical protein